MKIQVKFQLHLFVYTVVYALEAFDENPIFSILQKLLKSSEQYQAFKDNVTIKKTNN